MSASPSRKPVVLWLLLVGAVVAAALIRPSVAKPYDLRSTEPDGYRGLNFLMTEFGATVDTIDASQVNGAAAANHDVVFVPVADSETAASVAGWREFARNGGRLVLGTPSNWIGAPSAEDQYSSGQDSTTTSTGIDVRRTGHCDIDNLAGLRNVWGRDGGADVRVGAAEQSCYGDGFHALVVVRHEGAGQIVTMASPDLFTNVLMGAPAIDQKHVGSVPDNAVLAERLLAETTNGSSDHVRLAIVTSGTAVAPTGGSKTVTDFMSPGVKLGLLELVAAFGFYLVFRSRRHGRLVEEPVPVAIAGSSFTEAVGDLLERQASHQRAADVLRDGQCRELSGRLGIPLNIPRADLGVVLAHRTGRDAQATVDLLTRPVDSEPGLVELSRELDSLRQEVLHV